MNATSESTGLAEAHDTVLRAIREQCVPEAAIPLTPTNPNTART